MDLCACDKAEHSSWALKAELENVLLGLKVLLGETVAAGVAIRRTTLEVHGLVCDCD